MQPLRTFCSNVSAATAIEYALVASLISIAAVVAMQLLGVELFSTYSNIANAMS